MYKILTGTGEFSEELERKRNFLEGTESDCVDCFEMWVSQLLSTCRWPLPLTLCQC